MRRKQIVLSSLLVASLGLVSSGQTTAARKSVTLSVDSESYISYPSLQPIAAITVKLAAAQMPDFLQEAIGDPQHPKWDCTKISSYKVAILAPQSDGSLKEVGRETIRAIILEPNNPKMGQPYNFCDALGTVSAVHLVFDYDQLGPSETVQVSLVGLPDQLTAQSDGKLVVKNNIITFSGSPQAAPNEKLVNGKTRDTGQLSLSFSDSDLLAGHKLPFDTYVKSTDLFSTDEKDSKSAFAGTIGIQRGLFPVWYAPFHLDETIQGNQVATNLSSVTALGITTLAPWAWSRPLFYNAAFQAPLPPDLTVDNQYTNRINQLVIANAKRLATNDYSLNPSMSWRSISFPWACTVFKWLDHVVNVSPPNPAPQYCLGTELDLGGYYLPLDLTKAGHQQFQGYGDASILIPLSGLSFASRAFPLLTSNDPMKSQIRIKYSDTVTPANNYARSRGWTFGIEVIK